MRTTAATSDVILRMRYCGVSWKIAGMLTSTTSPMIATTVSSSGSVYPRWPCLMTRILIGHTLHGEDFRDGRHRPRPFRIVAQTAVTAVGLILNRDRAVDFITRTAGIDGEIDSVFAEDDAQRSEERRVGKECRSR